MTDHADDVRFWEAEVKRLVEELASAREALKNAKIATYPFAVGEVVEARFVRESSSGTVTTWEPVIIREIEPQSWGPWYTVSRHWIEGRPHSDHSTGRRFKKTLDQIRVLEGRGSSASQPSAPRHPL